MAATVRREQEMEFGTQMIPNGVRFRLWAPLVPSVELEVDGWSLPMKQDARGWYEVEVPGVSHGSRYVFCLPNGKKVPDPASRYQPEDVDGPSEVVYPLAFEWTDLGWRERSSPASADMLELYRDLLRLRATILTPRLIGMGGNSGSWQILGSLAFQVRWTLGDGSALNLAANLGVASQKDDWQAVVPLWCEGTFTDDSLGPYTALFWLT